MAHKSNGRRNRRQKVKAKYSKAREDAQLIDVIPTTPEGAIRDEVVNPSSQGEQSIPSLDRDAVRRGWNVPEETKRVVIDRLSEPFFEQGVTVVDRMGNSVTLPPDRTLLRENAKVLVLADQRQYERDNPKAAGEAKGGADVNVTVNTINYFELYKQLLEDNARNEPDNTIGSEPAKPTGPARIGFETPAKPNTGPGTDALASS